ncbi:MAG: nickel pincer cofactor biosynthesis protein LarC [Armatimonadetes bacterium]|nr:nickel pincer cofactor biosynthesis protein LarC [Armatimonadota bacterium]
MKIAYVDLVCGISGDMFLGALIDAGAGLGGIRRLLSGLAPGLWDLKAERVKRGGIAATAVLVEAAEAERHHAHAGVHGRSYAELCDVLAQAALDEAIKADAAAMLRMLAEAEASIHGIAPDDVHFHEVGGLDTLVDLAGTVAALQLLGVDRVYASAIPWSHGQVRTAHGLLPVPAPATAKLLEGLPVRPLDVEGETVTPTGAVLLRHLAHSFGPPPVMTVAAVGYGAGSREFPGVPNVLRVVLGEATSHLSTGEALVEDAVVEISANLDDMPGELFEAAMEAAFAAGALDVWMTPIHMKHNRPAVMLSALAPSHLADAVAEAIFVNTTTLGVRRTLRTRTCLPREMATVETPYGAVRVKIGRLRGRVVTAQPEYRDCAELAHRSSVTVREVYAAALAAAGKL